MRYFWLFEYISNCEQPKNKNISGKKKCFKSCWVFEYKWSSYMWYQNYKAVPQFFVPPPSKQQLYYVLFLHTTQKSLLPTITTNPQVNAILQFTSCNKTRYCKLINTCSKAPHQLHVLHPFFFSFLFSSPSTWSIISIT